MSSDSESSFNPTDSDSEQDDDISHDNDTRMKYESDSSSEEEEEEEEESDNKDMMQKMNELRKLKEQCEIVKNLLSKKEIELISNYKGFYKQITSLTNKLETEIFDSIPDNPESDDIPILVQGLKIDHKNMNLECIEKIDNYLEDKGDRKLVFDCKITPYLFEFCKSNNEDLQFYALSILLKLNNYLTTNHFKDKIEEKNAFLPIIELIKSKDFHVEQVVIEFIGEYVRDKENRRNLLIENGVLKYLQCYLDPSIDHRLLIKVLTTLKHLLNPYGYRLPLKRDTKPLIPYLNMLLFINNDEILINLFKVYENLLDNNCSKRMNFNDILRGGFSLSTIRSKYKKAAKNDDKLFKKSMEKYETRFDLNVPVVIVAEIKTYFDVFQKKKIKKMDFNVTERIISLMNFDDILVVQSLLDLMINSISYYRSWRGSCSVLSFLSSGNALTNLKMFLSHSDYTIKRKSCLLALNFPKIDEGHRKLIKNNLIKPILTIISCEFESDECDWKLFNQICSALDGHHQGHLNDQQLRHWMNEDVATILINAYCRGMKKASCSHGWGSIHYVLRRVFTALDINQKPIFKQQWIERLESFKDSNKLPSERVNMIDQLLNYIRNYS